MSSRVAAPAAGTDWLACPRCRALIYTKRHVRNLNVCPECGYHSRVTAQDRLGQLLDEGSAVALAEPSTPEDPLDFTDEHPYRERLRGARESTGLRDAVICARGTIEGNPVVAAVMDFRFMGGSLGIAVGERIAGAAEAAASDRAPLLLVTSSGGARMQEGTLALMQLAKTSAALADLDRAGILTIAVICDPTYAGVAASYASLPDVIIAEPGARMGFTGPRVIEQTIGQRLPEGFQTAEFLLEHGLVDDIVPRSGLRAAIARLLTVGPSPEPADGSADGPAPGPAERRREAAAGPLIRTPEDVASREPWDAVQLARNPGRPTTLDYLAHLLDWFAELHGDRMSGDCPAVVGGLGQLGGRPVVVIGHQKGHSTAELSSRGFGMPTPAGYRKAARLMRLAAKLGIPVITFVDTPGAHPGIEAEEGGQAIAIAENLRLMSQLPVPIVTVITGEGGSGGALALGVADRVLCLASSVYSVISPEGCAAILWRDRGKAPEAAEALRIDAAAQLRLGVVDAVVPEPDEGAHENPSLAARLLRDSVTAALDELAGLPAAELLRGRRERYREIGIRMAGAHEDG